MIIVSAIGFVTFAFGQNSDHGFLPPQEMKWSEGPASLAKGAKVALLEGDPSQEGAFTLRLQLPHGFQIQPHWHPAVEHVTVISGTFYLGMGEKFEVSSGRAFPAGSFVFMPSGMRHFAWAKGDTVIQLHGNGPWKINYVDPGDDPRNKQ